MQSAAVQQLIPGQMAARIIGLLQVVDVEQQHGSGITDRASKQTVQNGSGLGRLVRGIRLGSRAKNGVQRSSRRFRTPL